MATSPCPRLNSWPEYIRASEGYKGSAPKKDYIVALALAGLRVSTDYPRGRRKLCDPRQRAFRSNRLRRTSRILPSSGSACEKRPKDCYFSSRIDPFFFHLLLPDGFHISTLFMAGHHF